MEEKIEFRRLNHIQICIPKNKEEEAKRFYCDLLRLEEIEKPEYLRKNGGFWLRVADIELHIGTENVENKSKRHPAFEVLKLDRIKRALKNSGVRIKEDKSLPRFNRFSFYDPFNNRIELLESKTIEELEFLGKEVKIKIDRPIFSKHPKFGFEYELNYGFIPNTIGGDNKEIDAYILGEARAIKEFTGIVKAVIIRYDDTENKLVVSKPEYEFNKKELIELTEFQEKYFDTEIKLIEK